jgi:hypothetical protein
MSKLSPRQRQIYAYTRACINSRGYGPTVEEIRRHFRLRSATSVRRHLRWLERHGYIQRVLFTARAIQFVSDQEARHEGVVVAPRRPSARCVNGQVRVTVGTDHLTLAPEEAIRLAGQLVEHARHALAKAESRCRTAGRRPSR